MPLTGKQREFYASLEQTFNTPGWELITQGWKEEQQQLPMSVFFNAQSIEDIRAARVRFGLLDELISLPTTLAQQKLNAEEEGDE
ncbi:MAG: hypothetical protein ACYTBJ_27475 [Planctomycetota bacterium]|jgi:hypothetical protein